MNIKIRLWNRIKVVLTIGLCVQMVIMFYNVKKFEHIDEYFVLSMLIVAMLLIQYCFYDSFYKKCEENKEEYVRIDMTTRLKFLAVFSAIFIILSLYLLEFNTVMLSLTKVAMYTLIMLDPGYYVIKDESKYKTRATQINNHKTVFANDFGFMANALIYIICVNIIHIDFTGYHFGFIISLLFLTFAEESVVKAKSKKVILNDVNNEEAS